MCKTDFKPKEGVVYECYRGITDTCGDRVRTGQKFLLHDAFGGKYYFNKASGRGFGIAINAEDFVTHFCPASTPEKEDAAPVDAETPISVEAQLIGGTWDDVKERLGELPDFVQELLKIAKPELFEAPKPKVFEFMLSGNEFGTSGGSTPFYVGKGLVEEEDAMKCLIVEGGWKAELFEGPNKRQCIRFVEDK